MPNTVRAMSNSGEHLFIAGFTDVDGKLLLKVHSPLFLLDENGDWQKATGTQIGDKMAVDVGIQRDYRGLYPATWFQNFSASGTAAAVLTTPDISMYGGGMFKISGLTTETVAVTALIDGTVESGAICVRKTDGTFVAASALGNGTYYFDVFFKNIKFTKSAAVESIVLTGAVKAQKGV